MNVMMIAMACHEVNRIYCKALGDDTQVPWHEAETWQQESAINGVKHKLENPDATPEQMHNNWMAEKVRDGWVYGPTKDPEAKTHHCLVPYDELPMEQRIKDELFSTVVSQLAPALGKLTVPIRVIRSPAPDLPAELKSSLEMVCRNGMITCSATQFLTFVLHMAAVMDNRGEGYVVERLSSELGGLINGR